MKMGNCPTRNFFYRSKQLLQKFVMTLLHSGKYTFNLVKYLYFSFVPKYSKINHSKINLKTQQTKICS